MAGPPVRIRTSDGYRRDIETLSRIRIAIQGDFAVPEPITAEVVEALGRAERALFQAVQLKGARKSERSLKIAK